MLPWAGASQGWQLPFKPLWITLDLGACQERYEEEEEDEEQAGRLGTWMSLPWGTYLSLNTAAGLPGHPLMFMGIPSGVMSGLQQGWHSPIHNPQMYHPSVATSSLLSPPKPVWDSSHGGRDGGRKWEKWKRSKMKVAGKQWPSLGFYLVSREGAGVGQCSVSECQLSTWVGTRVNEQAEGWVGWPHPPALWFLPAHFSCCRKAKSPRCHSLGLSR